MGSDLSIFQIGESPKRFGVHSNLGINISLKLATSPASSVVHLFYYHYSNAPNPPPPPLVEPTMTSSSSPPLFGVWLILRAVAVTTMASSLASASFPRPSFDDDAQVTTPLLLLVLGHWRVVPMRSRATHPILCPAPLDLDMWRADSLIFSLRNFHLRRRLRHCRCRSSLRRCRLNLGPNKNVGCPVGLQPGRDCDTRIPHLSELCDYRKDLKHLDSTMTMCLLLTREYTVRNQNSRVNHNPNDEP